jgi:DNA-binding Lrp family transcriptional regulator
MANKHAVDERRLVAALQQGLPLVSRPYAQLAEQLGCSEASLIEHIERLQQRGDIKRFGIVVRHRKLGYRSNAMVVWNIDDEQVDLLGECFGQFDFVTLSYRRPRHLPDWPYNLFCMIHGQDRQSVLDNLAFMISRCQVQHIQHEVLFSSRCFKQRGAIYVQEHDRERRQA